MQLNLHGCGIWTPIFSLRLSPIQSYAMVLLLSCQVIVLGCYTWPHSFPGTVRLLRSKIGPRASSAVRTPSLQGTAVHFCPLCQLPELQRNLSSTLRMEVSDVINPKQDRRKSKWSAVVSDAHALIE